MWFAIFSMFVETRCYKLLLRALPTLPLSALREPTLSFHPHLRQPPYLLQLHHGQVRVLPIMPTAVVVLPQRVSVCAWLLRGLARQSFLPRHTPSRA